MKSVRKQANKKSTRTKEKKTKQTNTKRINSVSTFVLKIDCYTGKQLPYSLCPSVSMSTTYITTQCNLSEQLKVCIKERNEDI